MQSLMYTSGVVHDGIESSKVNERPATEPPAKKAKGRVCRPVLRCLALVTVLAVTLLGSNIQAKEPALEAALEPGPEAEKAPPQTAREYSPWAVLDVGGGLLEGRHRLVRGHFSLTSSAGFRWNDTGAFAVLSYNAFSEFVSDQQNFHVGHLGVGLEKLWFEERVRATLATGMSLLLSDTPLDDRGSVGWFLSIRPASFRWPLGERWSFELTPLMFEVSMPVISGIPLVLANYSTMLGVELRL